MYLYSICLVSTTCCDATITLHKRNTNIQELRTLPNTLLILYIIRGMHGWEWLGGLGMGCQWLAGLVSRVYAIWLRGAGEFGDGLPMVKH